MRNDIERERDLAWVQLELMDLRVTIDECEAEGVVCTRQKERHANLFHNWVIEYERYKAWQKVPTTLLM